MFKLFLFGTALAVANAGFLTGQHTVEVSSPSVSSQSENIPRGPGNVAQVSTYSKTIEGPFSSQSKSDVRISNPSIYTHHGPIVYNSHPQGIPATGFARGDGSGYPSGPSVPQVAYHTRPIAYATAQTLGHDLTNYGPSYTDHTVGSSRENTVHSLDGNSGVAHYSKAVDTQFSSVRKSESSAVTSDPKIVSVAPTLAYATSAAYASPVVAKVNPTVSYSSAPVVAHATFTGFGTQYNW